MGGTEMDCFYEAERDQVHTILCGVSQNTWCRAHFHSAMEILYVTQGSVSCRVNDRCETLGPHDFVVCGSYDIHYFETPQASSTVLLIIPVDLQEQVNPHQSDLVFASPFGSAGPRRELMENLLFHLQRLTDSRDKPIAAGLLTALMGIFAQRVGLAPRGKSANAPILAILTYLEAHYRQPVSLKDLARVFGYHPDHISRLFRTHVGSPFKAYLDARRLRHAEQLLLHTPLSMQEIAQQSGFGDLRNFNRSFAAAYHLPPSTFRRLEKETGSLDFLQAYRG